MSEQQQTLTIQQAIDLAVQHHNAGRLSKAENIYQQILQSEPNHLIEDTPTAEMVRSILGAVSQLEKTQLYLSSRQHNSGLRPPQAR